MLLVRQGKGKLQIPPFFAFPFLRIRNQTGQNASSGLKYTTLKLTTPSPETRRFQASRPQHGIAKLSAVILWIKKFKILK
jgi:hypothetical protein